MGVSGFILFGLGLKNGFVWWERDSRRLRAVVLGFRGFLGFVGFTPKTNFVANKRILGFGGNSRGLMTHRRRVAQRAPRGVRSGTDDGEGGGGASASAAARGAGPTGGELLFRCGAFGSRHGV